ncbi:MAG TPA: hypothetical protein ENK57_22100, partial [Polyangiaceae bacterium]|nr:hypothetical protein [Polyangiaceae bacterium]
MLAVRTVLVGLLVAAFLQFGLMALRYRSDVVRRFVALFAFHSAIVVAARGVLCDQPSAIEATIATRVLYSTVVLAAVVLPASLEVLTRRRTAALVLSGVALMAAVWIQGGMFDSEIVQRAALGQTYDIVAPGRHRTVVVMGFCLMMATSAWCAAGVTEPTLRRIVRVL